MCARADTELIRPQGKSDRNVRPSDASQIALVSAVLAFNAWLAVDPIVHGVFFAALMANKGTFTSPDLSEELAAFRAADYASRQAGIDDAREAAIDDARAAAAEMEDAAKAAWLARQYTPSWGANARRCAQAAQSVDANSYYAPAAPRYADPPTAAPPPAPYYAAETPAYVDEDAPSWDTYDAQAAAKAKWLDRQNMYDTPSWLR